MSVINVNNIGKAFRTYHSEWQRFGWWFGIATKPKEETWVLRHLYFEMQKGEAIGVIAQNAAASCFVFPSTGEGFALPPNEAMQCDCPVAVSDIAAHRYLCGDAALYFNPYDLDGMAATMGTLVNADKNSEFIQDLIAKGHKNVDRYSHATVLPQWEDLFDRLKAERK